jgi:hypothetical protein
METPLDVTGDLTSDSAIRRAGDGLPLRDERQQAAPLYLRFPVCDRGAIGVRRRRAIATTSGCAGATLEAAFGTDFIGLAMNCILPLYSNWSKAGVASHIGTQGATDWCATIGKSFG